MRMKYFTIIVLELIVPNVLIISWCFVRNDESCVGQNLLLDKLFATKSQRHEATQKTVCILSAPLCFSVLVAMTCAFCPTRR